MVYNISLDCLFFFCQQQLITKLGPALRFPSVVLTKFLLSKFELRSTYTTQV